MASECLHVNLIKLTSTNKHVCEDCVKVGDTWLHLRLCLTCGHVGCCDSSKNKHARRHYGAVGHPLIRSIELGESWVWCYTDEYTHSNWQADRPQVGAWQRTALPHIYLRM